MLSLKGWKCALSHIAWGLFTALLAFVGFVLFSRVSMGLAEWLVLAFCFVYDCLLLEFVLMHWDLFSGGHGRETPA